MENKKLNYTAKEVLQGRIATRILKDQTFNLIILEESENYLLTGVKNEDGSIYLDITEGIKNGTHLYISIYIDHNYNGKIEKVKINWSALGDTTPAEAKEFAELLTEASEFAEKINNKDFSKLL